MEATKSKPAVGLALSILNAALWFAALSLSDIAIDIVLGGSALIALVTGAVAGAVRGVAATILVWGAVYGLVLIVGTPSCELFDSSCGDPDRSNSAIWAVYIGLAIGVVVAVAGVCTAAVRHVGASSPT